MRVTAIIADLKYKGGRTKWRGPLGTPEEKQTACVNALQDHPTKFRFDARTEAEEIIARSKLREVVRGSGYPPIDCQRRVGYWLLAFNI